MSTLSWEKYAVCRYKNEPGGNHCLYVANGLEWINMYTRHCKVRYAGKCVFVKRQGTLGVKEREEGASGERLFRASNKRTEISPSTSMYCGAVHQRVKTRKLLLNGGDRK